MAVKKSEKETKALKEFELISGKDRIRSKESVRED
jgi:hypothetical protein